MPNIKKSTFTIEHVLMPKCAFLKLFNDTRWRGDNGEYIRINKTSNGYTSHADNGRFPVEYYWDTINNGTVMVGKGPLYSAQVTQIDVRWSDTTKQTTLTFTLKKSHVDQKGWQRDQIPKNIAMPALSTAESESDK